MSPCARVPGCSDVAEAFRLQEIDGQALLLLTEDHLMTSMNIKLGPALKICAHINSLKNQWGRQNKDRGTEVERKRGKTGNKEVRREKRRKITEREEKTKADTKDDRTKSQKEIHGNLWDYKSRCGLRREQRSWAGGARVQKNFHPSLDPLTVAGERSGAERGGFVTLCTFYMQLV